MGWAYESSGPIGARETHAITEVVRAAEERDVGRPTLRTRRTFGRRGAGQGGRPDG